MLRGIFMSVGLFITLCGGSLLMVDKLVLNKSVEAEPRQGIRAMFSAVTPAQQKVIDPPDWAAFSLMSVGTVTMLYSVALPKKKKEG